MNCVVLKEGKLKYALGKTEEELHFPLVFSIYVNISVHRTSYLTDQ